LLIEQKAANYLNKFGTTSRVEDEIQQLFGHKTKAIYLKVPRDYH